MSRRDDLPDLPGGTGNVEARPVATAIPRSQAVRAAINLQFYAEEIQ